MARIFSKLTKEQMQQLVRDLPGILSGKKSDRYRLYHIFWGAVAYSMFTSISEAFEQKSEGETDELGNSWEDLDRDYKAYKRPANRGDIPGNLRRRLQPSKNALGLLTPSQHKRWQQIFGTIYHAYKEKMGSAKAKELAGQLAWTRLKDQGAQTKRDVLGNRKVTILRVSDKLFLSLSPGKFNPSSGYQKKNSRQVFQLQGGKLIIGTNVEYASFQDDSRPVWPEEIGTWIDRALSAGHDAIYNRLLMVLAA